jgi:class 3 adenylate cyclase
MAARIKGNAAPGQVVVSGATARLLPKEMAVNRIGMVAVRGRVAEVEVFRLLES